MRCVRMDGYEHETQTIEPNQQWPKHGYIAVNNFYANTFENRI